MFHYTALVTCLAILFYFFTSIQVSKARVAFDIKVPATSGNLDFERVFRVQMNTLEWMPIFLPSLWLFAIYISDGLAAAIGLVWIAGRILYMTGYSQAAKKRGPGFGIQAGAAHAPLISSAGSRCSSLTGTPCRPAPWRAACSNPRASWSRTAF
jgi:glutathione S-transferase